MVETFVEVGWLILKAGLVFTALFLVSCGMVVVVYSFVSTLLDRRAKRKHKGNVTQFNRKGGYPDGRE